MATGTRDSSKGSDLMLLAVAVVKSFTRGFVQRVSRQEPKEERQRREVLVGGG